MEVPNACVDDLLVELFVILEVSFRFSVVFDDMVVTLVTSIKLKISFCHLKTMPDLLLYHYDKYKRVPLPASISRECVDGYLPLS